MDGLASSTSAPLTGDSAIAHALEAALTAPGRPSLIFISGRSGAEVLATTQHLVLPSVRHHLGDTGRLRQTSGLAWEHGRPHAVLQRLQLPTDEGALAAELAEGPPTAIMISEAQDADPESLHVLSSVVHRLKDVPVLVVVTAVRSEHDLGTGPLGDIHRAHRATSFALESLDVAGVHELATSFGHVLDESTARRLWQHTEGSPSQIIEMLQHHNPSYWSALDSRLPATPSALSLASHELGRCDADVRTLVEACAVLGRWTSLADLTLVSQVDDVLGALDRAEADRLLAVRPGLRPLVGFPSRMARAAAYETMGILRRRQLHERASHVLSDRGEALQHRAHAALKPDAQIAHALDGHAYGCANRGAWREASAVWLAAHRLATDTHRRDDYLIRSMDALISAGEIVHATAMTPELESIRPTAARLAVQGYLQLLLGHRHEASDLLHQAWEECDPADDTTAAVIAHRLSLHSLVDWDCEGILCWTSEAMARVDATGPAGVEASTIRGLGLGGLGQTEAALAEYSSVTSELVSGAQSQRALMGQGWLHLALDSVALASHELALSAPRAAWGGSTRVSLWSYGWLARARIALGDLSSAQSAVERGVQMLNRTGQTISAPLIHWAGAEIAALRGDWAKAEYHATQATAVRLDYQTMNVAAAMARATVAMARAGYPTVVRILEPIASGPRNPQIDEPGFWPWQAAYATALVAIGEHARADEFLAPHERLAEARGRVSAMAHLASVRGRIEMASGDIEGGRASFAGALEMLEGEPLGYLRTRIQFGYGQALRRAGKRRDAEHQLTKARLGYATMGAEAYVVRCDRELKAGTRTKDAALTDLTPQERAVVELVVQGMSNGEAAAALFVSVKTVQYHLTRVYRRLGIRSRSELVALTAGERGAPHYRP